jgi:GxxExxY protein
VVKPAWGISIENDSPQITQITQIKSVSFQISRRVIGCAMNVHNTLGCGFLEDVYENALAIEMKLNGIAFQRQFRLVVRYRDEAVGRYCADLIVENELLVELKAIKSLDHTCEAQLLNYLNASKIQLGLLINFGTKSLQLKRMTIAHQKSPPKKSV